MALARERTGQTDVASEQSGRAPAARPLLGGMGLVDGAGRLIAMFVGLSLIGVLPVALQAASSLADGPARQPYFVDVAGRLPLERFVQLWTTQLASLVGVTIFVVVVRWLLVQLLLAGGLWWVGPHRSPGSAVTRRILGEGARRWSPMLRIGLVVIALAALGGWGIGEATAALADRGERAGWTAHRLHVVLPAARVALQLLWVALVGCLGFWWRVVVVADGRRAVRGALMLALRLLWRCPARAGLFYSITTLLSTVALGALLVAWRQHPPLSERGAWGWLALWLAAVVARGYLWYWTLRAARLVYALPGLDDLRARPDEGWGVLQALRSLWRRRRLRV